MIQKPQSLIDQLYEIEGKAEIVGGRIVRMSPATYRHGRRSAKIYESLRRYERRVGGGVAIPDNVGFIVDLPNRQSFCPDAAWLAGEQPEVDEFIDGAPTFAVEVRSKRDRNPAGTKRVLAKIADYFAAGALVVWDVDLESDEPINCYRASDPASPEVFRIGQKANAEPAVPGWSFSVRHLFADT